MKKETDVSKSQQDHFTHALLPRLERIAYRRFKGCRDWEDRVADFIAASWEIYAALAKHMSQPPLRYVLGAMRLRPAGSTAGPRTRSLSIPHIRRQAEAIPA